MKTIPMLPTLAGGSGVAAHALASTDLMWVVDSVLSDANRDRQATLAELQAYFNRGAASEILHNPAATGNQILATIPNWNGSSGSMSMVYGILRKDVLGIYTLDMAMNTPTAPASWTASGTADIQFVAGSGAGTTLWDAFLAKIAAEQSAGYALLVRDYAPCILQTGTGNYPASPFYPKSTFVNGNAGTHTLTLGINAWDNTGVSALWSAFASPYPHEFPRDRLGPPRNTHGNLGSRYPRDPDGLCWRCDGLQVPYARRPCTATGRQGMGRHGHPRRQVYRSRPVLPAIPEGVTGSPERAGL